MNKKVSDIRLSYPQGEEPNLCVPEEYEDYRYLLGRLGAKPLVVICMNPSAAKKDFSDKTVNRIINVSKRLGYDGWVIANVYPERATNALNLDNFDSELAENNVQLIVDFLLNNGINEIWGAWGNLERQSLVEGKKRLLLAFRQNNIRVFSFAPLTQQGQPVHPLNRRVIQDFSESGKIYLDF
ncbi:hypothetical protein EV694_0062 [Volucribacter psittacicida]|uniref:DUF1643 domain-containing protein n=1 Tax=Volucribacter psittacicida TaxID=203482 RepID=A0A4R1G427_9PAST|nr:DUF1643 domain-containing protein [Volucribacter psittacicida]TCK01451.1 hypothetical protein EV694_0062 [Volucribacter psittacicida]